MSTSATLEGIWEDFRIARKEGDLDRMRMCLKEFDLEYDSTKVDLPKYAPQKQMARRGVIRRRIEEISKVREREGFETYGSW